MPDKRLIDANALVDKVRLDWGLTHQSQLISATTKLAAADAMCKMLGEVAKCQTIDAVPVVRCKDCVHAIVFRTGSVSCRYHDWCRIHVDPDGYCNHGEKDIDGPIEDGGAEC